MNHNKHTFNAFITLNIVYGYIMFLHALGQNMGLLVIFDKFIFTRFYTHFVFTAPLLL